MSTQRPAVESDRRALEGLIALDVAGTPYGDVPAYFLRLALEGKSSEARVIVADHDGEIVGCAIFGEVAGSVATGRLLYVGVTAAGRASAVDVALCGAAVRQLVDDGARLIVAELPEDTLLASYATLLRRCGFAEAGRVDDYYRDGVALVVLAKRT